MSINCNTCSSMTRLKKTTGRRNTLFNTYKSSSKYVILLRLGGLTSIIKEVKLLEIIHRRDKDSHLMFLPTLFQTYESSHLLSYQNWVGPSSSPFCGSLDSYRLDAKLFTEPSSLRWGPVTVRTTSTLSWTT